MPEIYIGPQLRQPPSAPYPGPENGVEDRGHEDAVHQKCLELPALGQAAGDNGGRCIHEDHLEEEEQKNPYVIDPSAGESKSFQAKERPPLRDLQLGVHYFGSAQCEQLSHAPEHEGISYQEISEGTDSEDSKIGHHDVARVAFLGEAGLNHGEARLHKEDQYRAQKAPHEIDGYLIVAHLIFEASFAQVLRRSRLLRRRIRPRLYRPYHHYQ